ncbi:unnamed protein product, partial [Mesorhabditis belari]|uniref:Uncharacterized protein n=1 Tax=Mesorhabditis belari TaxID=2138241 RepID=A0AAF3EWX2_9BILA
MSAKWHKKPQICDCVGKIISVDSKGEFAYIESPNCGGKKETVYATRNTFRPPSKNLNNEIKKNDTVTARAIEQHAAGNQGNVRFRTTIFTFGRNGIDADGGVYDKTAKRKIPGLTTASPSVSRPLQTSVPWKIPSKAGSESMRGSLLNSGVNVPPANQKVAGSSVLTKSMFIPTHPSTTDEYEIAYEKIRQLSHAIAGNRCNHCLTRRFDPNLKP